MIQFYHSLISEQNLCSWDAFWLLVALALAGKSPKSQEVCPVWRNVRSPPRLGGAPSHLPALPLRPSLMDPFTSCSKNVPYFPSVFPRQALSLLLVDVLSYISMSPSAQLLNKGMEDLRTVWSFRLRKGLERWANVTEECREGRSARASSRIQELLLYRKDRGSFSTPVPAVINAILHFIVIEKHPKE